MANSFSQKFQHLLLEHNCILICYEKTGDFCHRHILANWLNKNNVLYESQKRFTDCNYVKPLPFDFYLPDYNVCIEYDGEHHFRPMDMWGGYDKFIINQENDNIKNTYCQNQNITLLRLPYTYSKEDIKNEKCTVSIISPEEYYVQNNTNATVAWGKLYKKSCFRSIRYPIGKIHEDEAVTHCLLFEFRKIAVVKETLYFYYVNPLGITKSQWNPRRLDSVDAMEKQMHYMKKHGYKVAHVYSIKK